MEHASKVHVEEVMLIGPKTPRESHTMFLNNIDQRFGFFGRNLFVYENDPTKGTDNVLGDMKNALQDLLVPYHFFAGRFHMNHQQKKMEICCNNAGALFVSAVVDLSVADVKGGQIDCEQYLYFPMEVKSIEELPLLSVQVTRFKCKGFAIGILIHHAVADATSTMNFMINFSSIARGIELPFVPNADRSLFKARVPPQPKYPHEEHARHPNISASRYAISLESAMRSEKQQRSGVGKPRKVFHFSAEALNLLKRHALPEFLEESSLVTSCSTFEALAAHVWREQSKTLVNKKPEDPVRLRFFLDVRNIVQPALGNSFCGNAIYCVNAEVKFKDMFTKPLAHIIRQIQKARKQITDDYIRSGWDFLELNPDHWYIDNCDLAINAWPRMMLNAMEMDFGWGKPARVEFPLDPGSSTVVFFPGAKGGIDVSMCREHIHSSQEDVPL